MNKINIKENNKEIDLTNNNIINKNNNNKNNKVIKRKIYETNISIEGEYNKIEYKKMKGTGKKIHTEYYNFSYKDNQEITKLNLKSTSKSSKILCML